jgi:hypothetical protein
MAGRLAAFREARASLHTDIRRAAELGMTTTEIHPFGRSVAAVQQRAADTLRRGAGASRTATEEPLDRHPRGMPLWGIHRRRAPRPRAYRREMARHSPLPPRPRPRRHRTPRPTPRDDRGTPMSLACVRTSRGCKPTPRRHLPDCEHATDGQCWGCLPRLAEFGALCLPDHYGLVRALHDLPHARTLLAGHLQPSYARRANQVKATKGNPPVPLNLGVLDLGLEFDHIPMAWARIHAEEHDLTAPTDAVAHLRTTSRPSSAPSGSPTPGTSSPPSCPTPTPSSPGGPKPGGCTHPARTATARPSSSTAATSTSPARNAAGSLGRRSTPCGCRRS